MVSLNLKALLRFIALTVTGCLLYFTSFTQKDLGNGFFDHGATSRSVHQRGVVATSDGAKNVILSWLFDHRGGFSLLMLDAKTGQVEQISPPHPINRDAPFASLLSKDNKYYTLFNGYFTQFDPVKKQFTFSKKTSSRLVMSMLEDTDGNIWAANYLNCGLVKFNPSKNELTDYGSLNKESWAQYPRHIAADKYGWIYIGIGTTATQVIAFNTRTEKAKRLFSDNDRIHGTAYLYKGVDGVVYAKMNEGAELPWMVLENGVYKTLEGRIPAKAEYFKTGTQNFIHRGFPNGDRIIDFNLRTRTFAIQPADGSILRKLKFDYDSDGSWSLGINAGPDGKLYGGTAFPMQMFAYNPATDSVENFSEYSQLNAMMTFNGKIFSAGYPTGDLIQYTPGAPWTKPISKNANTNPKYLYRCSPHLNRPHSLKGLSDGQTIVLGGTPDYGYTGGGLLFYDLKTQKGQLLKHTEVVENQSTMSITELSENRILGGTTVSAGTGGEVKSKTAFLYIMDVKTKKIEWRDTLIENAKLYNDLCIADRGIVYGFANNNIFFAFDTDAKKIIYIKNITNEFERTTGEQCQRIFVKDNKDNIYVMFKNKIGKINRQTHELELVKKSPVEITAGGDYLNGRIYFISQSHICSYKVD